MEGIEEKYLIGEKIGCGASGCVYRATDKQTGEVVAIKEISLKKFSKEKTVKEIENIRYLTPQCPQVVRYIDYIDDPSTNRVFIITEYIDAKPFNEIKDRTNMILFKQLVKAIQCIHFNDIYHSDIKPDNIIFTDTDVKIIDIGMSCTKADDRCWSHTGFTPNYASPEALGGITSFEMAMAADIWGMAASFYKLLNGKPPLNKSFEAYFRAYKSRFKYMDLGRIARDYQEMLIPSNSGDKEMDGVMDKILVVNWEERPKIEQILEMIE